MRTSICVPLAALIFVACSSSTETPHGAGGKGDGGSTSTGGTGSGGINGTGGHVVGAGGTSQTGGAPGGGGGSTPGTGGAGTGGRSTPGTGGGSAGIGGTTNPGTGGAGTGGRSNPGTGGAGTGGGSNPGAGGARTDGGATPGTGGAVVDGGTTPAAGGAGSGGGYTENSGAACNVTAAAMLSTKNPKLPNPFAKHDGTIISAKADWECRRNEIKKDLEKYEIGTKPEPPTVAATLSGTKLSVVVTTSSGSITLSSTVSGSGSCVVIGMNATTSLVSGCTQVPFSHDQVVKYGSGSTQYQTDPFYTVYPSLWGKIGNYNAWSWGISRLIDGLDQVKDQLKVDMTKIATWGCSYAGKMSLFGGAFDERVALTIVEESGGGGIDSWRASADFTKRTGTSVEKIDNTNYSWFLSSMKSLDPYSLPHDHHELIAMIAPRATIILGNDDYDWLGDESGYKSTMAAIEVFKALGVADNIGYDFTSGHNHCAAPTTQQNSVKTFADRFLKGGTGATNVAIKPPKSGFDLTADFDWTTPTLQ
ncbi:MAG TPA: hypothetical protein VF550_22355 [Polyangia bacterium]